MLTRARRSSVAIVASCAVVAAVLGPTADGAFADSGLTAPQRAATEKAWRAARCSAPSLAPVTDGQAMRVSLPPATYAVGSISSRQWNSPASLDPTWQMNFYSLGWVAPLAKRAWDDDQRRALATIASQVDSFYRLHPDRGRALQGWDEGTSLRRLGVVNCLYILTGDKRLAARMKSEVTLLFGPRYYGPPHFAVHNHGLMANMQIVRAAKTLGRSDWSARARARMRAESRLAFTATGTTREQSAEYQLVNASMWRQGADLLSAIDPRDPVAAEIHTRMARADSVSRWLTEPDGDLVQIGDTGRTRGTPPAPGAAARSFRDDQAGLLVGRWSWKDPATSYFTLRYGPPRWAHGHHDKGGVTWSTTGARVLIGPGYYSYDWRNRYAAYARTMQAHNTSSPVGRTLDGRASAALRWVGGTNDRQTWRVTDKVYGVNRARTVSVTNSTRSLVVADSYPRGTAVRQSWHLDPAWVLASARGKNASFRHPDGRILSITTTGSVVSASRGRTNPVAGWTYPKTYQRVANWELVTGGSGAVTTTFRVH